MNESWRSEEQHRRNTDFWAADHIDEGSCEEQPAEVDSQRVADLQFLHVLLERVYAPSEKQAMDRRVQRVMAAVEADLVEPAQHAFPFPRQRWLVSTLSAAASLAVLAGIWFWFVGSTRSTAFAAVQAVYREAAQQVDRQYRVVTRLHLTDGQPATVHSMLYVRGSEKFVLQHHGPKGDIWIGSNGREGWFISPFGIVSTNNDPMFTMSWARDERVALPDLTLTALVARLTEEHTLELLPPETLPDTPQQIVWQRVRAVRRIADNVHPIIVDLWVHPETGVAQRIVLDWLREPDEPGFARVRVDLDGQAPLANAWYEASEHIYNAQPEANPAAATDAEAPQEPAASGP